MAIFDSSCAEPLGFVMPVVGEPEDNKLILEKQIIDDLLEKLPACCGSRKFITVFQGFPICSLPEPH
jgi:hypothetical protein